jgi:hypothetical protein
VALLYTDKGSALKLPITMTFQSRLSKVVTRERSPLDGG